MSILGLDPTVLIHPDFSRGPYTIPGPNGPQPIDGNRDYNAMVAAATKAGCKIVPNAGMKQLDEALLDPNCTEIILFTHGTKDGLIKIGNLAYAPDDFFPNKNRNLKVIKVICCHWKKCSKKHITPIDTKQLQMEKYYLVKWQRLLLTT